MAPRYPNIRVRLHSRNPYAMVSAVRSALRHSRVDAAEIRRFTDEALVDEEPLRVQNVCASWADVDMA
ncbi:MAG: hypothetical protein AAGM22_10000 [Acidobacteriota bacterium]